MFVIYASLDAHAASGEQFQKILSDDLGDLRSDYVRFYLDGVNLMKLGAGVAAAGALANTRADREMQNYYQDDIRSYSTNKISKAAKLPGEFYITIPALLAARLAYTGSPTGVWAQRSLRALFTGGPAGVFLQYSTGASRPSEGASDWKLFKGNNGLSGHAFIGAVPFITAARMTGDPYLKTLLYGLSAMPALSRINDNEHYPSQAMIGWYLAYLSALAVEKGSAGSVPAVYLYPAGPGGAMAVIATDF